MIGSSAHAHAQKSNFKNEKWRKRGVGKGEKAESGDSLRISTGASLLYDLSVTYLLCALQPIFQMTNVSNEVVGWVAAHGWLG